MWLIYDSHTNKISCYFTDRSSDSVLISKEKTPNQHFTDTDLPLTSNMILCTINTVQFTQFYFEMRDPNNE